MGDTALAAELGERGIRSARVLTAVAAISRSDFVPAGLVDQAAADHPLPIGNGQTISQPYVVAFMTEALELLGGERVLEIGTGSGYQTALLAKLAAEVYSMEVIPELATQAKERLERLDFSNVHLRAGDGFFGWPEAAPFDRILLTAAPEHVPPPLLDQLRPGGKLVAPVGPHEDAQELIRLEKGGNGIDRVERLLPVRFVPMRRGGRP